MNDEIGQPHNLRLVHSGDVEPPCDVERPRAEPNDYPQEGYALQHTELPDPVNPPHYKVGGVETIDIIEHIIQDYPPIVAYNLGSVLKYLARAPHKHKNPLADLNKARWFLDRAIQAYGK